MVNFPSSVGMVPLRLLVSVFANIGGTSNSERIQHLEKEHDKQTERVYGFLPRSRYSKLVNCPSSFGIVPVRLLIPVL